MVEASHQDTHKREENKRIKQGTGHLIAEDSTKIGGELRFSKNPQFIKDRLAVFEQLFAVQQKKYEGKTIGKEDVTKDDGAHFL
jgi:hypothetical protein